MKTDDVLSILLQHVRLTPNTYFPNKKTNDMSVDMASLRVAAEKIVELADSEKPNDPQPLTRPDAAASC